ncbi:MAG: hypothetical protein RLZZ340_831, partial [Actinomycetota bacterium]
AWTWLNLHTFAAPQEREQRITMTKILVVEDEQGLREPLVYLLKKEGYEVCEAADGDEAIREFKAQNPDLINHSSNFERSHHHAHCQGQPD